MQTQILKNLTPHPLVILCVTGTQRIPQSGDIARVRSEQVALDTVSDVPVFTTRYTQIDGLPEPKEGVTLIVSSLIQHALKQMGIDRPDVLSPGTGPNDSSVKEAGRIVAVTRLVRV
jgi:hypothetical protein